MRLLYFFSFWCLCASILLVLPVEANPVIPSVWKVHFLKDGLSYNESVDFTITCYGYWQENQGHGIIGTHSPHRENGTGGPGLVFSKSASCTYYGCPVIVFMSFQDFDSEWCNLEGKTQETEFFLGNYSRHPLPGPDSCTFIDNPENSTGVTVLPGGYWISHSCTLNFSLPSSDQSSGKHVDGRYSYTPQSPVESLYCGILSLFGASC
jgi:hypothetical protein